MAVTGAVNYIGPIKMVDHKGEVSDDDDGTTVHDAQHRRGLSGHGTGSYNCGVFTERRRLQRLQAAVVHHVRPVRAWATNKNLDFNFSIQNLFDKKAPFDPYLAIPYGINYNQTWHQPGAVGRFFTVAAKYSF